MSLFVLFLIVHGVLGGLDVIVNHELIVGLPGRPGSAPEQRLHSARAAIFASLFLAMAWREWHGAWVLLPAGLMLAEFLVSLRDVAIEGASRILPVTESTLHVALFVNLGAVFAFGGLQLWDWSALPTELVRASQGWPALVLSVLAAFASGWSVRDALSARRGRVLSGGLNRAHAGAHAGTHGSTQDGTKDGTHDSTHDSMHDSTLDSTHDSMHDSTLDSTHDNTLDSTRDSTHASTQASKHASAHESTRMRRSIHRGPP